MFVEQPRLHRVNLKPKILRKYPENTGILFSEQDEELEQICIEVETKGGGYVLHPCHYKKSVFEIMGQFQSHGQHEEFCITKIYIYILFFN